MLRLLRLLASWSVRRTFLFLIILLGLVALVKVQEAYQRIPAAQAEIATLERQQALIEADARRQLEAAQAALGQIEAMEAPLLRQRLAQVRAEAAALEGRGLSRTGYALQAVRGNADAIAASVAAGFRLQLLRREEAVIAARLAAIEQQGRARGLAGLAERIDRRMAQVQARIAAIERDYPILREVENVPLVRNLVGPSRELRALRAELARLRAQRARVHQAQQATQAAFSRARAAYAEGAAALTQASPPTAELQQRIERQRQALSQHWASRLWEAVRPVLGWALWLTLLLIVTPPAIKAFWFFIVAPVAARLEPVRIRPEEEGRLGWASDIVADSGPPGGSRVSRHILLRPGDELLIRPEYLQSSVNDARIDSKLLLSRQIPLGSIATGLVGLTRIRADRETSATVSAMQDPLDEVGILFIPEGSAIVFRPRNLIGLLHPAGEPVRLERIWRLGHASAWLTLQLRHLLFHGPCALVVKGARGIAMEPAPDGRRIAGAATMGWSARLRYSVRRSETFFAYLTGKQSLFNDNFEGDRGKVIYEEMPRAGSARGLFGRGLQGIGDAMLKVVGL